MSAVIFDGIVASGVPASIPSPPIAWQAFNVGPLVIHTYALIILLGIIVATLWSGHRLTRRGGEPGVVLDIVLWTVPLGIVGARFYHVFTHPTEYYYPGAPWWGTFAIWDGGNAIFGAMIGGVVGILLGCHFSGLRFWSYLDALAPAMLLAQAIGRFGNYVNHELYGLPTNLPWGLQIESSNAAFPVGLPDGTLFQPLFLYEIIWDLAGVVVLLLIERKWHLRWGKLIAVYFMWYGIGRTYLESIRIDPSEFNFFGVPANVWAAFLLFLFGIVLFIVQTRRHPGLEPSVYRRGREWRRPEPEIDSYDTYSDDELAGEGAGTASRAHESDAAKATSSVGS